MPMPDEPKIYHIVHVNRLPSVITDGHLWCDATMAQHGGAGTTIGMSTIKQRRLEALNLASHPQLHVGDCVPFYFCPRSVMLYVIHMANHPELDYRGGQGPIVHLEADLRQTLAWANAHGRLWAFTTSNAGSRYFEDYSDIAHLDKIDWGAVQADYWSNCKDGKQAEFLVECSFPWALVSRIGVQSPRIGAKVQDALRVSRHRPSVAVRRGWYY